MEQLFEETLPAAIVVQGDTTSAFAASLAGFLAGVPVAHVLENSQLIVTDAGVQEEAPSLGIPVRGAPRHHGAARSVASLRAVFDGTPLPADFLAARTGLTARSDLSN